MASHRTVALGGQDVAGKQRVMSVFLLQAKRFVRGLIRPFWSFISSHPRLRRCALAILRRIGLRTTEFENTRYPNMTVADLSFRAARIYADLKVIRENHDKESG